MKKSLLHALNKSNHHSKMYKNKAVNKWLESLEGKEFLSRAGVIREHRTQARRRKYRTLLRK